MAFYRLLGGRLRLAREAEDLTLEDVSKALGMSIGGYARYESGERRVPADTLNAAAKFFRRPIEWFYGIDEEAEERVVVFGYHLERLPPEDFALLREFVKMLFGRRRQSASPE